MLLGSSLTEGKTEGPGKLARGGLEFELWFD